MPKTLADFQQQVDRLVQDTAQRLPAEARDSCIVEALTSRYSKARHLPKVKDLAGDGATYKWTLNTTNFPGWTQNFSVITGLEYPAGDREPKMLTGEDWLVYWPNSTAPELRLRSVTPAAGKTLRVTYATIHAEDGSTVPDGDFYGVVNLAASLCCRSLAAAYAQSGDTAIGADAVDYRGKSQQYAELAKVYEERFKEAFGLDEDEEQSAASATAEWQDTLADGGERITH